MIEFNLKFFVGARLKEYRELQCQERHAADEGGHDRCQGDHNSYNGDQEDEQRFSLEDIETNADCEIK